MQIRRRMLPLALLCAALLSACGGGGSSGSSNTPPVSATLLTSSNFTSVAANAWAGNDVLTAGNSNGGGESISDRFGYDMTRVVADLGTTAKQMDVLESGSSIACPAGGSLAFNLSLKTLKSLTPGARMDLTGLNCVAEDYNTDGKFSVEIAQGVIGNLDLLLTNLALSKGVEKIVWDGDVKIRRTNGLRTTSGNRLRVVLSRNGSQVLDQTLTNFSYSRILSGHVAGELNPVYATGSSLTGTLTTQVSGLGAVSMNLQTNQAFIGSSNGNPQSGVMTMTAGTGSIKLTALDGNKVRLDFSANGDATINQTQTLTWDEFKSKK